MAYVSILFFGKKCRTLDLEQICLQGRAREIPTKFVKSFNFVDSDEIKPIVYIFSLNLARLKLQLHQE